MSWTFLAGLFYQLEQIRDLLPEHTWEFNESQRAVYQDLSALNLTLRKMIESKS